MNTLQDIKKLSDLCNDNINIMMVFDKDKEITFDKLVRIWKFFRLYDSNSNKHFPSPTFETPQFSEEEMLRWKPIYDSYFQPLFVCFLKYETAKLTFYTNGSDEYDFICIFKNVNNFTIAPANYETYQHRIQVRDLINKLIDVSEFNGNTFLVCVDIPSNICLRVEDVD